MVGTTSPTFPPSAPSIALPLSSPTCPAARTIGRTWRCFRLRQLHRLPGLLPNGSHTFRQDAAAGERCLTWHNEKDASVPFLTWIDRKGHNALVGCLRCQRACPYNKNVMSWMEAREEFSGGGNGALAGWREGSGTPGRGWGEVGPERPALPEEPGGPAAGLEVRRPARHRRRRDGTFRRSRYTKCRPYPCPGSGTNGAGPPMER